jgi:ABC-type multidrug transport system fused ATPase/permease subunit
MRFITIVLVLAVCGVSFYGNICASEGASISSSKIQFPAQETLRNKLLNVQHSILAHVPTLDTLLEKAAEKLAEKELDTHQIESEVDTLFSSTTEDADQLKNMVMERIVNCMTNSTSS